MLLLPLPLPLLLKPLLLPTLLLLKPLRLLTATSGSPAAASIIGPAAASIIGPAAASIIGLWLPHSLSVASTQRPRARHGMGTGRDGRCAESLEALPAPTHTHTHTHTPIQNHYPALRGDKFQRLEQNVHLITMSIV